jgi:two-component system, OmpR family, sensor histidine kinase KdpD
MAHENRVGAPQGTRELARSAGLESEQPISLDDVDKRRTQLWSMSLLVVIGVTLVLGVLSFGRDYLPEQLQFEDLSSWMVIVLLAGLALALLVYVVDKEITLRRLSKALIEERILSSALSNRLTEISRLSEVGKAINTTLNIQDVLSLILDSAVELLGGNEASIMLVDDAGESLQVAAFHGPNEVHEGLKKSMPIGTGIAGHVVMSRTPLLLQGPELTGVFTGLGHPQRHIHSAMCVPLVRNEEVLGVLNVNDTVGTRRFTDDDLRALGFFAEHAAVAIGNARLFAKERETVLKLEDLDRLKSDFVATVSHELKSPLTSIIGSAKTLTRKGSRMDPEQQQVFIEMIERQGNRLLRLVEDVLTTSRIESGTHRMRRELIDLREAAEVVIQDLKQTDLGMERPIMLTTHPDKPQAWGDLTAIQQILVNLIENALKYSQGKIDVFVQESPTEAVLQVSDEGRGISDEELQLIFERFQQVDSGDDREVSGFGLGLFIVKSIVDAHRGRVEVTSQEGTGTTFKVRLPKRASDVRETTASITT